MATRTGIALTVTGRTIAETLKSVKWLSRPARPGPLRDGDIIEIDEALNVKLTDAELAERKTK